MANKSSQFYRFWRFAALFLLGTLTLSGLTLVCFRFHVSSTTVGLLYLIVIVLISLTGNLFSSVLVALIAYLLLDYFFTPSGFSSRIRGCDIVHHAAAPAASDHLPLVAEVDFA